MFNSQSQQILQSLKSIQNLVAQPDESRYPIVFNSFELLLESLIYVV